jgi:hypothetical protein
MDLNIHGDIGDGHDACVERIEIGERSLVLVVSYLELYVPKGPDEFTMYECTGRLQLDAPQTVSMNWHKMSLDVLDSELLVGGAPCRWEILRERCEQVSLKIVWNNGATFAVENAAHGQLHLETILLSAR